MGAIQGAVIPGYSGTTYAYYVIWDLSAATRKTVRTMQSLNCTLVGIQGLLLRTASVICLCVHSFVWF